MGGEEERDVTLDFAAVRAGRLSYADLARDVDHARLRRETNELFDQVEAIAAGATDREVVFVPEDPEANDRASASEEADLPWTLGHVVVHMTASWEEAAALGATLARGVPVEGRSRYETPWETIRTAAQVRDRLAESRRMCNAFLDAWPDAPHLDLTVTRIERLGPLNATGQHLLGLFHGDSHLDQLREILRQSRAVAPAA